jgi:type III secretion system FlhB-like substrate exporter
MIKQIPTATAVVVNPTHYSVAMRYSMETAGAPVVVAKGKNYLARRIREIATEHNIPIVENQPLAQALYKSVEVGQEIPAHLYRAVAEILGYIYRLMNGRLPGIGNGDATSEQPRAARIPDPVAGTSVARREGWAVIASGRGRCRCWGSSWR